MAADGWGRCWAGAGLAKRQTPACSAFPPTPSPRSHPLRAGHLHQGARRRQAHRSPQGGHRARPPRRHRGRPRPVGCALLRLAVLGPAVLGWAGPLFNGRSDGVRDAAALRRPAAAARLPCTPCTPRPSPQPKPAGGTLIECQRLLATQGAAHVSAYVTHGVFPNESWRRFEGESGNGAADGFRCAQGVARLAGLGWAGSVQQPGSLAAALNHQCASPTHSPFHAPLTDSMLHPPRRSFFWITDSCPRTVTAVTDRAPFEVLSLAQPIAAALQI